MESPKLLKKEDSFFSLPDEMMVYLLCLVDVDTLLNCRLVNSEWRYLIDTYVFQEKASKENQFVNDGKGFYSFSSIGSNCVNKLDLPWYVFYVICKYDPFDRNLIKNHCGQNDYDHWSVPNKHKWWAIETTPQGAPMLPNNPDFAGYSSCFVSTYRLCTKKQKINFKDYGLTRHLMENIVPKIVVSEWFSGRFDCGCKYSFKVTVHDNNGKLLEQHNYDKILNQWEADQWTKVSHTFDNSSNVSSVVLFHSGVDTQFWAGFYGTKITGSVVKIMLPLKFKLVE
ncbi:F-box only protein 6-like [Daktulosphaira vitifoliae]|uniref:F-box only protein 6-like n=1 Tax=Daktulosphaira vitifoliae TaxID=58002 RepID=UPI0021A997D7|nr:F-box only protein 6-like [Daktulosphaira vitifoliae]